MQTVFSLSLQDGTRSTSYDPIKSLLKTTAEATSQFTCLRLSSSAKGSFWDAPKQKFLCLVDTEAERQPESEGAQLHSTQLPKAWKGRGKEAKLTQTPHSICTREEVFLRSGCHLRTALRAHRYSTPLASLLQAHQGHLQSTWNQQEVDKALLEALEYQSFKTCLPNASPKCCTWAHLCF